MWGTLSQEINPHWISWGDCRESCSQSVGFCPVISHGMIPCDHDECFSSVDTVSSVCVCKHIPESSTPMADCADGELRLVDGIDATNGGRLEICFNSAWGTICGDRFNQTEAAVACGQLGFSRQGAVPYMQA